jgi:large subunit ribosomal protein L5
MHLFKDLNEKIIKHDLINKYIYKNTKNLPKLKNITLNFGCNNFNIQKFAITLLALEIITSKKGSLTASNSANVLLKIQKGQPAGCKVTLEKKDIYKFLDKLIIENLPRLQNFSGFKIKIKTSTVSFKLSNKEISLQELNNQYPLFENLPYLDINISTTAKSHKEILFLLKSIKIPIYEKKTIFG